MDLKTAISQHLEIPKIAILQTAEYPDGRIAVILTNYAKHVLHKSDLEPTAAVPSTIAHLSDIVGLGRTSLDRLEAAGITTVQQLLAGTPEQIAKIVRQNVEIVKRWQKDAAG